MKPLKETKATLALCLETLFTDFINLPAQYKKTSKYSVEVL